MRFGPRNLLVSSLVVIVASLMIFSLQTVKVSGSRYLVMSPVPLGSPSLPRLDIRQEHIDIPRALTFLGSTSGVVRGELTSLGQVYTLTAGTLWVYDRGGLFYQSANIGQKWLPYNATKRQALDLARQCLEETGGYPPGLHLVGSQTLKDRGASGKKEIVGYTFLFRQHLNGQPLAGSGLAKITVGNAGVVEVTRSLFALKESGDAEQVITARKALSIACASLGESEQQMANKVITRVRLTYLLPQPHSLQSEIEPVWEVRFRGLTCYLSAYTGQVLLWR